MSLKCWIYGFVLGNITDITSEEFENLLEERGKLLPEPAVADRNKISYYPHLPLPEDYPTREVRKKKGKMMKPGKFLGSLFPESSDRIKQKFAQEYKDAWGIFSESFHFEIWKQSHLAYQSERYRRPRNESTLWESCMVDETYVEFWTSIGVEALVALNREDEILGRALLWNNVKDNEGNVHTLLDRIYTFSDDLDIYFLNYAKENNWIYKKQCKNSGATPFIFPDGEEVDLTLHYNIRFDLDELKNIEMPYSDTLKYISLSGLNNKEGIGTLDSTDGKAPISESVEFDVDGDLIDLDQDEWTELDGEIYPTNHEDIVTAIISITYGDYELRHIDECVYSSCLGEYILEEIATLAEDEDDYLPDEDCDADKDGRICFRENLIYSKIYGDYISEILACHDPRFGLIYTEDMEYETFTDLNQTGDTLKVEKINGYILVMGELIPESEVVVYDGAVYKQDELHSIQPKLENTLEIV